MSSIWASLALAILLHASSSQQVQANPVDSCGITSEDCSVFSTAFHSLAAPLGNNPTLEDTCRAMEITKLCLDIFVLQCGVDWELQPGHKVPELRQRLEQVISDCQSAGEYHRHSHRHRETTESYTTDEPTTGYYVDPNDQSTTDDTGNPTDQSTGSSDDVSPTDDQTTPYDPYAYTGPTNPPTGDYVYPTDPSTGNYVYISDPPTGNYVYPTDPSTGDHASPTDQSTDGQPTDQPNVDTGDQATDGQPTDQPNADAGDQATDATVDQGGNQIDDPTADPTAVQTSDDTSAQASGAANSSGQSGDQQQ